MKTTRSMSFAVLLLCVVGISCDDRYNQHAKLTIARSNNAFASRLYQYLGRTPGNIFFSPLSLETVLSLAWLGAGGKTAEEMVAVLNLPDDKPFTVTGFRELLTHFQSLNKEVTLETANKIFARQGAEVYRNFQLAATRHFLAESEEVNFQRTTDAAETINKWVAQKTRDKIRNLISPDSLDYSTLMVLVNAIYFKGKWLTQFDPEDTLPRRFFLDTKTRKEVKMMNIISEFPYAEIPRLKAKALQMPYVGEHLSMVILLPEDIEGLPYLESRLTAEDLTQIINQLSSTDVGVSIPKFKMEATLELTSTLNQMGMQSMFGANANFSGIAKHNLAVSSVLQKAFIDVTEEGSEAAAATGVQIVALSGANYPTRPKPFNCDHPFIFFIQNDDTGAILFMGRFTSP